MKRLLIVVVAFLSLFVMSISLNQDVSFASDGSFNPGRIIDDDIFYDSSAMGSAEDVQRFIQSHTPTCDTQGSSWSGYGSLTRAEYATQIKGWHGPPYVCLQNYHENPTTGETSYERGGAYFPGGISAGQIIWDSAQKYSINPQVLLVLLRKESAGPLFADSWPLKSQYTYAMGYACPDSGPNNSANCDPSQGGFRKQIERAAWQLRLYRDNITDYGYQPGRTNRIGYSPDPTCGYQDVYIQNYATASLYIYTPYVPNAATLSVPLGQTAPCGAYGNKNFFYFFREWFGSTTIDSNFLRTVDDATVYLVSGGKKYPVSNGELLSAASPLGPVGYVSKTFLDSKATGSALGRFIKSPDGSIYYFDSGIKLPFSSCDTVADYGGELCGSSVELTQSQIDAFHTGPRMTNGMKTTSGKTFYVKNGKKQEIYDEPSASEAGLKLSYNVLKESSLSNIPYSGPIVRSGVSIENRQNSKYQALYVNGVVHKLSDFQISSGLAKGFTYGKLDNLSILNLPQRYNLSDILIDESGTNWLVTRDGKKILPTSSQITHIASTSLPSTVINNITGSGSLSSPALVKSMSDSTVYAVVNGEKRPLLSMSHLKSITSEDNPYIGWTSDSTIGQVREGNVIVKVGSLVKTPSSATVYMSDGYDNLIPLASFAQGTDIGISGTIITFSDKILGKYTVSNRALSSYVSCSGSNYLGVDGALYSFPSITSNPVEIRPETCSTLKKTALLPQFVKGEDGTIFKVESNILRPITSWATYIKLNSSNSKLVSISRSATNHLTIGSSL